MRKLLVALLLTATVGISRAQTPAPANAIVTPAYARLSDLLPSQGLRPINRDAALLAALQRNKAPTLLVTDPRHLVPLREIARDRLILLQRSPAPEAALRALDTRPAMLEVIHSVPRTAEHVNAIHGATVTASEAYLAPLRQKAASLANIRGVSVVDLTAQASHMKDADWVMQRLSTRPPGQMTVLIGHVERDVIVFKDASRLSLEALTPYASSGRLWVLGCNTAKRAVLRDAALAVTRRITYGEALEATRTIALEAAAGGTLRSMLLKLQQHPTLTFAVGVSVVAITVGIVQRHQAPVTD